ncbi:MAG: hypothetical protein ACI8RD_007200, partial [Bacillariaceae sp.]
SMSLKTKIIIEIKLREERWLPVHQHTYNTIANIMNQNN